MLTRDEARAMIARGLHAWFRTQGTPVPFNSDPLNLAVRAFQLLHRRIPVQPRSVNWSSVLGDGLVPHKHRSAVKRIVNRAVSGGDLNPFLSHLARKSGKDGNDHLRSDWGIDHLHLGRVRADGSVERSGDLLFLVVRPAALYLLDILDHESFVDENLFKVMEHDFPGLVERYLMPGVVEVQCPDEDGRELLQGAHISTWTKGERGYYFAPGGGVSTSGRSIRVVDDAIRFVNNLTFDLMEQHAELRNTLGIEVDEPFDLEIDGESLEVVPIPQRRNRKSRRKTPPSPTR